MQTITIPITIPGEMPYEVHIGSGLLPHLGQTMRACAPVANAPHVFILTDSNVGPLYLDTVCTSLEQAGYPTSTYTVQAGEQAKSIQEATRIWNEMAACGLTRNSCVLALGGGVVGDLAGFSASTFMRGVAVVQVPTTLLSMVDSSVGGKTAINLEAGKNMVGTFCQPALVCADIATLETLDQREWACGLGEVAKSAIIDSPEFFTWLQDHAIQANKRNPETVADLVKRCVTFKARVVTEDKAETKGVRECLNYGHTLAHAIELIAGYGTFSHGEAVVEGMRFAALLASQLNLCQGDFQAQQTALFDSLGLAPLAWQAEPDAIVQAMLHDKKTRGQDIRFVFAAAPGQWNIQTVSYDSLTTALASR